MPKMNRGSMATSTCRYVDYREYSRAGADKNLEVTGLDFAHARLLVFFARSAGSQQAELQNLPGLCSTDIYFLHKTCTNQC